eukprot:scaffold26_cov159-Ochromonas_danica.AAC.19
MKRQEKVVMLSSDRIPRPPLKRPSSHSLVGKHPQDNNTSNNLQHFDDIGATSTPHEPLALPQNLIERLYPHQKVGVDWMYQLFRSNSGGVLGDDMGMGKVTAALSSLSSHLCLMSVSWLSRLCLMSNADLPSVRSAHWPHAARRSFARPRARSRGSAARVEERGHGGDSSSLAKVRGGGDELRGAQEEESQAAGGRAAVK